MWTWESRQVNTLRPRRNGQYFTDDIFKLIFFNENVQISIKISLKFVPNGPINNIPSLVHIMAWRRPGDKPLSKPMMVSLLTHICVTLLQRVNHDGFLCVYMHWIHSIIVFPIIIRYILYLWNSIVLIWVLPWMLLLHDIFCLSCRWVHHLDVSDIMLQKNIYLQCSKKDLRPHLWNMTVQSTWYEKKLFCRTNNKQNLGNILKHEWKQEISRKSCSLHALSTRICLEYSWGLWPLLLRKLIRD